MPIKNYTTTKEASTTTGEIQAILAKHGATMIMISYFGGEPDNLSFVIETPNGKQGVQLPANVDMAYEVLKKENVQPRFKTKEHARKVAWRILKDWLEAQLALLEMEMVTIDQIMLPYFINKNGQTVYELYNNGMLMLEGESVSK